MDRFLGFKVLLLGLLFVLPFSAQDQNAANIFSTTYNHWIELRNNTPAGTIDAHEATVWKAVQRAWKDLDHAVKYE